MAVSILRRNDNREETMKWAFTLLALGFGLFGAVPAALAADALYVPIFSYRTGPFASSGIPFANGIRDYLTMLNVRDGGIGGAKLAIDECETGYDTKKGIECYEAAKSRDPVVLTPLSTGIGLAVLPRLAVDKVPMLTMAYGLTASAMGDVFPWAFNPPDTYWDTAGAMLQHIANAEGGLNKLSGKTIGYIYLDAPYGKEAIPLLEQLSKTYGYTLKLYPVAGTEMQNQSSQWLSVRRDKPDWMMMFGWGALHPTALKEAARVNFPMDHFISNFWMSDHDIQPSGEAAKGFREVAFHAAGTAFPALRDIETLVVAKAVTDTPKEQMGSVLYNHGIYNAMLIAEAITNAQKLSGRAMVTGEDVRRGFEAIDLTASRLTAIGLGGFTDPLKLSCADHNGHGRIFVQSWDGTKWVRLSEPEPPMVAVTQPLVEAAAKDYVEKNTGWPKRTEACDKAS
jgi:branched-chain amino acid transport system substrate-binding protein